MTDSADGLRERRRAETTRTLIRAARRFTAERGLAGFTVEDLCAEAEVSRRTFFNYFASKDDAVLGVPLERSDAAAIARFLARGSDGPGLSPNLLTELALLAEERWRALDIAPDTVHDLFRAVEKEPRLLARMLELGAEGEQFDARLIEQRENLPSGDLRAQVAVPARRRARALGGRRVPEARATTTPSSRSSRDASPRRADLFATQNALMGTPE